MKNLLLPLLIVLLSFPLGMYSQQVATTSSGERVILNEDGTWVYEKDVPKDTVANDHESSVINCDLVIKVTEDKVTGDKSIMTDLIIVSEDGGNTGFGISLFIFEPSTIYFYINAVGGDNCIDEKAKINILFTDGTRVEFLANNKFNCEKTAGVFMGTSYGNKKYALMLAEKQIDIMRVRTGDKYVERQFTAEQAKSLQEQFICANARVFGR